MDADSNTVVDDEAASLASTGVLGGYGSFNITVTAVDQFQETSFGTAAFLSTDSFNVSNDPDYYSFLFDGGLYELGVSTPTDYSINTVQFEAIVFTFDTSSFTGNLTFDSLLLDASTTAAAITIYDASDTSYSNITIGNIGDDAIFAYDQAIEDGDRVAMWRNSASGGQYRLKGLGFSAVPEASAYPLIVALLTLTAAIVRRRK